MKPDDVMENKTGGVKEQPYDVTNFNLKVGVLVEESTQDEPSKKSDSNDISGESDPPSLNELLHGCCGNLEEMFLFLFLSRIISPQQSMLTMRHPNTRDSFLHQNLKN